jgi:3-oxoacyl-[acyl-carrier-protein] synthase-3
LKFKIISTGSYIPPFTVTNDDISKMVETNDEWITKRVGIKERHIATTETTSFMATEACKRALEQGNVDPKDIDLIIGASVSSEYATPSTACLVQKNIGASCPAFDVSAACPGLVFSMETAAAFLSMGKYKKILIFGAERLSGVTDWTDRSTCIIFGDGSGAMVVSNEEDNYLSSSLFSEGNSEVLYIPRTSGTSPFYKGEVVKESYIRMNGHETYRFAVKAMRHDIIKVMDEAGLKDEDIKLVIPHQANIRIIDEAKKKIPIAPEKFMVNIDKYGNTSSASVGILLDEINRKGLLNRGDVVIISAFGAGLCSGACAIRW